ncbi:MAG: DUF488 domain-containing protein [Candidatus Adiutrix sp.]|jgi:uncharacterized protein (DUF488 family)|nr:DUF488 domain-containing protein [Candidatus Adiutrix sp.]
MELHTIGYEGLDMPSFLSYLREYGIQTVIDVRQFPVSRKPGFSKSRLCGFLKEINIHYEHFQALGCPRPIRRSYQGDGDWKAYCRHFNGYLDQQAESLRTLADLADQSSCALLCFEADHRRCHRSLITETLRRRTGATVRHIVKRTDGFAGGLPAAFSADK